MKTAGRLLVHATAVGLALVLLLPWCNVLVGNVVPVLQALMLVWVVAALTCFGLSVISRRRWALIAFTPAFVLALAASWLLTTSGASPSAAAEHGSHRMTVLSLNAQVGEADPGAIMRLIRTRHPDVVVFVEMTRAKLDTLESMGLKDLEPHHTDGMIDDGARGSVILSHWALTTVDADDHLRH